MKKEELAREIYRMRKANGNIVNSTEQEYVRRCLQGIGSVKPMKKAELQGFYDYLKEER